MTDFKHHTSAERAAFFRSLWVQADRDLNAVIAANAWRWVDACQKRLKSLLRIVERYEAEARREEAAA